MKTENMPNSTNDYKQLKSKMYSRLLSTAVFAVIIIYAIYSFIWFGRGSEILVRILTMIFNVSYDDAVRVYDELVRENQKFIWLAAVAVVFIALMRFYVNWFARYFNYINQGINALTDEESSEIRLPSEMAATERKLNAVKQTLHQRTMELQLAEQRKNELVMYLAHDIRTPLTSVIGYLNLLTEAPDMPDQQKARYINITLDKAYRLEKMVNEFFEITRYNRQQIGLVRENIDLYYMLVQLVDELSPVLQSRGNRVVLKAAEEELVLSGDADKLARVFNNVLRNAAAYSEPETEIIITAAKADEKIIVEFQNQGPTIPPEKLAVIFDKFYRLDEARTSDTGGAGLGLAIAREIVTLHGGTITAASGEAVVVFTITLPKV